MKILSRSFYHKDTLEVAKGLLGCFLLRMVGRKVIRARIVETEAYVGEDDLACHASKGRTKRTETMYGEAGHAYVYMIYGMYTLLNIVTEAEGYPAAVLIRGLLDPEVYNARTKKWVAWSSSSHPFASKTQHSPSGRGRGKKRRILLDGPGKLCRFLDIDRDLNGWDVTRSEKLWIETSFSANRRIRSGEEIVATKRVGVDYAKHCREYLWRFVLEKKLR